MNCKKCSVLIDKEANFCPYCGEVVTKEETKREYDDPFKDLRIDTTHDSQFEYQQNYSNQNQSTSTSINLKPKSNKSLIGLILGIASIFICFIGGATILGIGTAIIALILAIVGFKQTSKGFGITSIIITIFTFIITIIINILMFVGSIQLTFVNGYTISIKDYLIDAFNCGLNEHRLQGYWVDDSNELLYLDTNGDYYIYLDATDLTDNYYYGSYTIEDGMYLGGEDYLFADDDYYLYEIRTSFNKTKSEGILYPETIDLIENGFTLKLDRENHNRLILVGNDGETEIEFERQQATI